MTVDLHKLDQKELDALIRKAQAAKAAWRERRRAELRAEFERRAAADGFSLAEIAHKRPASKPPTIRYVHPTDPALSWSGLGRVPAWLKALAGADGIERFRVERR